MVWLLCVEKCWMIKEKKRKCFGILSLSSQLIQLFINAITNSMLTNLKYYLIMNNLSVSLLWMVTVLCMLLYREILKKLSINSQSNCPRSTAEEDNPQSDLPDFVWKNVTIIWERCVKQQLLASSLRINLMYKD